MNSLTTPGLVRKRVVNSRWLLAGIFAGVLAATTLVSAVPVYISSIEQLNLNLEIDRLGRFGTTAYAFANNLILTESRFAETDQIVDDAINRNLAPVYDRRERLLGTHGLSIELDPNRLPASFEPPEAFIRHLSNLEKFVTVLSGRNAESTIRSGPDGLIVEAIVSENATELFGIAIGHEVVVGVAEDAPNRVTVQVVGVVANSSLSDPLVSIASGFLNPPTEFDPEEDGPPPLPLFVTEQAITEAIGPTFPGIVMDSIWFIQFDSDALKDWTGTEILENVNGFESEINRELIGAHITTPLRRVVKGAVSSAFFARVPMLLLLAVLTVTVAFYLGMMVTYLVQSRAEDAALMRTRGVGFRGLLKVYSFEGLVVTVVAIVVSPLIGIALVMAAGTLPSFSGLTGGSLLPLVPTITPFMIAAVVGLICLAVIVVPSTLIARGGLLAQRFRSARPPIVSIFHSYYLDVLLLVIGGLVFWELQTRGELVSGGLFRDVEINEALLFAPVLFLIAVALVFMRLFPLLVRYLGGESPSLLHFATVGSLAILIPGVAINGVRGAEADWVGVAVVLALFGLVHWGVSRTNYLVYVILGIVAQAALAWLFYRLEPMNSDSILYLPFVALVAVVVGQVAFLLLRAFVRLAPVWISMSLWHVARRPLQYTWLVVLIVLVTGVSVLSTTVGGTLEQSQLDRVNYQVAGDVRIGINQAFTGGVSRFRENPRVALAADAIRVNGTVGSTDAQVFGVDTSLFHRISWYRDDFSERSLSDVMAQLEPQSGSTRAVLPEGAKTINLWARPAEVYDGLMLNVLLMDAFGEQTTVFLGEIGEAQWNLMTAEIPTWLRQPVTLTAVHLHEQSFDPDKGRAFGTLFVDYIHTTVGEDDEMVVLEDFESSIVTWLAIIVDPLAPDLLTPFEQTAYNGSRSARFTFGQATEQGVRGFYKAPTRQFLPVVFSSPLLAASGFNVGDTVIVKLAGREIIVIIMDTVRYFPTITGGTDAFIITDVDLLLGHVNVLGSPYAKEPTEVYARAFTDDPEQVKALAVELNVSIFAQVMDRASLLENSNISPATSAAWRTLAVFALVLAVLTAASGYVSYLMLSDEGRRTEVAFLQSMGLSRVQLIALIAFEQVAIIAISLGLGTWAGFQMSRLLVSPLAISEAGGDLVPPFLLLTDWTLLAPVYAALVTAFVCILLVVNWRALRVDLAAIARVEA